MSLTHRVFVIGAQIALVAAAASGQTNPPPNAPPNKVAVVDIRQAVQATAEGKQAAAELQSQFSPRQTELENLQKSIEELQNRLNAGARTLSDDERVRLQRQGERQASQLKRKQEEFQEDVNAAQQEVFDRMGRKMVDVISRYARENGYGVILDAASACGVYCSNQLDVTQDIIRLYDQANPVKAGGTTAPATQPRPVATRPAAQPAGNPPANPPANPAARPKPPR
jgi:outer membrane protein